MCASNFLFTQTKYFSTYNCSFFLSTGYLSERSLTDLEWSVLPQCVIGRFLQSLVMGAYTLFNDPGKYVTHTALTVSTRFPISVFGLYRILFGYVSYMIVFLQTV